MLELDGVQTMDGRVNHSDRTQRICYATFELTALSLLKQWTWRVVVVDVSWGMFMTALSSTLGLLIVDQIARKA